MKSNQNYFIDVTQLQVGIYVHLDLGWLDHPFTTSNFKIKNEAQIATIRKLGLKRLRYDPKRSESEPLSLAASIVVESEAPAPDAPPAISAAEEAKLREQETQARRMERLRQLHQAMDECEKKFITTGNVAKEAIKDILQRPEHAIELASQIINEMVDSAFNESEIAVVAVSGNRSDERNHVHALNVVVLTLMMARTLNISEDDARLLGLSSLFHDVGKADLPSSILLKKDPLTKTEQSVYERHSELGAQMAKKAGLPERLATVIMQHHEFADGSGYPNHLKGEQIDPLARLLLLINHYDYLCNPHDITQTRTPYEALAYMFANQRNKFDDMLLKQLIKTLGVYPPGSIVQLSNGMFGVVVSVNPTNPLRPVVMLYDKNVDRNKPLIVSLRENPEYSITICIRPNQLPKDAFEYLNPRKRISYFWAADLDNDPAEEPA